MALVTSLTEEEIDARIAASAQCVVGPTLPDPPTGVKVLWLDTSEGTYLTMHIVTGD